MTIAIENAAIHTSRVRISNGTLQIDAYLAEPAREGIFPAIVVAQEIFGVNTHIRDVTERLAKAGYVAITPSLFQRVAPDFEAGYGQEDIQVGRGYKEQTKSDELLSDVRSTIAYLQNLPNVKGDAIGSIGFCFGGHVVYFAATLPEIKATASFYGGGIATSAPGGGNPTIERTTEIKGTIYAFFGEQDAAIPLEDVDRIEAALTNANIPHRVFRYPEVGHGFFCDKRASYNAEAAADAWKRVLELFEHNLQ